MELLNAIWQLIVALGALLSALLHTAVPWLPLVAWIAFWLLAVNWSKLYPVLDRDRLAGVLPLGLIGILLIGFLAILTWGVIAPPDGGVYNIFGLQLSNFVGKTVYVTGLFVIAAMCASVQLSGFVKPWCLFDEPEEVAEPDTHHAGHH
ncbi:MAG: hypothetical protein R3C18_19190 [Planctomycetaceae bacterium]